MRRGRGVRTTTAGNNEDSAHNFWRNINTGSPVDLTESCSPSVNRRYGGILHFFDIATTKSVTCEERCRFL
jgi:hypothetical protein